MTINSIRGNHSTTTLLPTPSCHAPTHNNPKTMPHGTHTPRRADTGTETWSGRSFGRINVANRVIPATSTYRSGGPFRQYPCQSMDSRRTTTLKKRAAGLARRQPPTSAESRLLTDEDSLRLWIRGLIFALHLVTGPVNRHISCELALPCVDSRPRQPQLCYAPIEEESDIFRRQRS